MRRRWRLVLSPWVNVTTFDIITGLGKLLRWEVWEFLKRS
jgi:hypothetical protein